MGFGEAVSTCFRKYGDFSGRARRSEYWYFALAWFLAMMAIGCVYLVFALGSGTPDNRAFGTGSLPIVLIGLVFVVLVLGGLIPSLAVAVRRLHDLNASGWWLLLFFAVGLIPVFGTLSSLGQIIWFCQPGTTGENRYGPDPIQ